MKLNRNFTFAWKENEDGACLLRVYADTPELDIPAAIDGLPVTEIGAYCFSKTERLPKAGVHLYTDNKEGAYGNTECDGIAACGTFLERITLPRSVRKIGNYAFYGCRGLKELHLTEAVREIGSDAFLNCTALSRLFLSCGRSSKTGLKQLLAQLSWNIEVVFLGGEGEEAARLFFPEYYEVYHEIGPAHIFELKLTGEGFRARQCFCDSVFSPGDYDAIFPQACIEEQKPVLIQMAMDRLCFPSGLSTEAKKLYQDYIKNNQRAVIERFVAQQETEVLQYLLRERLVERETVEEGVRLASESGWTEGTASLIRWKNEYLKEDLTNRYQFEDF